MSRTRACQWWLERSVLVSAMSYVSRMASKTSTQRMPDWRTTYTGQSRSSGQWMSISVRRGLAADLFRSGVLSGREPRWPSTRTISSTSRAKSNFSFPFERRGSKGRSFQCSFAGGSLGYVGRVTGPGGVTPCFNLSRDWFRGVLGWFLFVVAAAARSAF